MENCNIKAQNKLRNGYPNWWCFTHFAPARGEKGVKLDKCSKADEPPVSDEEKIFIDVDDYKGGVGIWGSLEAVYDSKREVPEKGVHVHLRVKEGEEKVVDQTFKEVYIAKPDSMFEKEYVKIDEYTACAYTASILFNKKLKVVNCKYCNQPHIDADWFAVNYHKKHFCTFCGRDFIDTDAGISNPVIGLQELFKNKQAARKLINVDRALDVKQEQYPGGIQIWASNPAIIWTASRAEEAGIHVHLFTDRDLPPTIDDTFGSVIIDGMELNSDMVRMYMVQKSFSFLHKYLVSLNCPKCGNEHFDKEEKAFVPHREHHCEHCGNVFTYNSRLKGVVSNPILNKLRKMEENFAGLNKN